MKGLILLTFLFLAPSSSLLAAKPTQYWNAFVSRVIDGDTIVVRMVGNHPPPYPSPLKGEGTSGRRQGDLIRIRLAGIDCPEKKQAYGLEATRFLSDRILGKSVLIQTSGSDRYGRLIGTVWLARPTPKIRYPHQLALARRDEKVERERGRNFFSLRDLSLNEELIKAGLAWHYKKYSKDRILEALEAMARKNHRGLWMQSWPVAPWKWRR